MPFLARSAEDHQSRRPSTEQVLSQWSCVFPLQEPVHPLGDHGLKQLQGKSMEMTGLIKNAVHDEAAYSLTVSVKVKDIRKPPRVWILRQTMPNGRSHATTGINVDHLLSPHDRRADCFIIQDPDDLRPDPFLPTRRRLHRRILYLIHVAEAQTFLSLRSHRFPDRSNEHV